MTSLVHALSRRLGLPPGLRLDPVVAAFVVLVAALALALPGQARQTLAFTAESLLSVLPFLAVSVLIAAYARASGLDRQVARAFAGSQATAIALAAVFGALSPFCSCGVVPIIAGLLGAGVPLAPVMAFWIASPIMDPEMFVLTAAVLGTPFALAKAASAIAMGLVAGIATHLAAPYIPVFGDPLKAGLGGGCRAKGVLEAGPVTWRIWRESDRRARFGREAGATAFFLGKWLALAFAIESLMLAWIPADVVGAALGGGEWWTVAAAAIVGVPAYLNGYAAIPTVSGLIDLGMTPAAGLAFMLGGSVTSIPAAMAVAALVKRPVFAVYIATGLVTAVAAGIVFGLIVG